MASISNRVKAKSIFGQLDPSFSLAAAALLSIVIACLQTLSASLAGMAIGLALLLASQPDGKDVCKRFGAVNAFILFLWLVLPFTSPGPDLFKYGWLNVTINGISLCVLITLKANAILAIFIALIADMNTSKLAAGLNGLHFPAKLTWILLMMDRNIHLLKREWRSLNEAAALRAYEARTSLASYATLATLLALLLTRAHDRGEHLREAMLLAGFNGTFPFTSQIRPAASNYIFCAFCLACAILLVYLNYA